MALIRKPMTEEAALLKLADYCARGEHCSAELLAKLAGWGVSEDAQMRIMQTLSEKHYFDDERFARAFAADRLRFGKWGPRKIDQALWQKHIPESLRREVLDSLADEYLSVLRPLLKSRRRTVKAAGDYELRVKLMRYALGRGFTLDQIRQCMDVDDDMADEDDFMD